MENNTKIYEDLHNIKNQLTLMKSRSDIVYFALVGSELTKEGGLINKIAILEARQSVNEKTIERLQKLADKKMMYMTAIVGIISATVGSIATILITSLLK